MTHASLFSGIGGFDLAATWMNWQNIFQVEIDPYCQLVLQKHFPHAHRYTDIRTFDARPYRGAVDVISGGFPCQPFSVAGKRLGNEDDRALWPEMLRVIREVGPRYVVGENVAGLLSMDGGRVFDGIHTDLENAGYTVETYLIPAVGVGAPHKRDRLWIVAHNDSLHCHYAGSHAGKIPFFQATEICGGVTSDTDLQRCQQCIAPEEPVYSEFCSGRVDSATPDAKRLGWNRRPPEKRGDVFRNRQNGEGQGAGEFTGKTIAVKNTRCKPRKVGGLWPSSERTAGEANEPGDSDRRQPWAEHWLPVATRLCRVDDGLPAGMDGTGLLPTPAKAKKAAGKSHRLKGLGNAIVPHLAFQIFEAIDHQSLPAPPVPAQ
jgi:DNA (cytosine-5)-methyltransferase 1